jgi:hypothetical protein
MFLRANEWYFWLPTEQTMLCQEHGMHILRDFFMRYIDVLEIFTFVISKDATKETKSRTELLGRKNGWKIPNIEKAWD